MDQNSTLYETAWYFVCRGHAKLVARSGDTQIVKEDFVEAINNVLNSAHLRKLL